MSLFEEIQIEKFCELLGTLSETISSQALFCKEGSTTIRESGVGCKLLALEAQNTPTDHAVGDDIVSTACRHAAAHNGAGAGVAISSEDNGIASILLPFLGIPPLESFFPSATVRL